MKKKIYSLAIIALALSFTSCKSSSSSFESDVKKMANYRCEIQKLMAKDPDDEAAQKQLEEVRKKLSEFDAEMEKKYKGKEDQELEKKAKVIFEEVMKNCK